MASFSKYNLPEEFPTLTLGPQHPPNWSELPFELLTLILHRLPNPFSDHVRFAAVCRSWRYLFFAVRRSRRPPPLLLVKLSHPCSQYQLFHLTLADGRPKPSFKALAFKIQLAPYESIKAQFSGPLQGWLFVDSPLFRSYLLNPLSDKRVCLPRIPHPWSLFTIAVSPDAHVIAHVFFGRFYMLLCYCRLGDRREWRRVLSGEGSVFSLTLTKSNQLYTICGSIERPHMLSMRIDGSSIDMPIPPVYAEFGSKIICPLHFVEGSGVGEMLMVAVVRSSKGRHRVVGFRVFRLEMGCKWIRVRRLGDDRALLVNDYRSEFVLKGEVIGSEFEANCVYYFSDRMVSVFSLREERFKGRGINLPYKLSVVDWFMPATWP